MGIYTNNFYVAGSLANTPIYANTLSASNSATIEVESDIRVRGDLHCTGRMDTGNTIFTTFKLSSNLPFSAENHELHATSNSFAFDMTETDFSGMSNVPLAVARSNIYDQDTGRITVPVSGLYSIQLQASFCNIAPNPTNGLYIYMLNHVHSNVRRAPVTSSGPLLSTSFTGFLLGGDVLLPTFYSNDPDAVLVADAGETLVSYAIPMTVTPSHSNYMRA